jgi:hypothetical protein
MNCSYARVVVRRVILGTEDSVLVDYIEFPKEASSMQANVIERGNLVFESTEGEIKKLGFAPSKELCRTER